MQMFYFLNTCRLSIIFLLSSKRDDFSRLRIFNVIGSFLQQNFLRRVKSKMDTSFVANVHEVVFATFLATYCSPALNLLISKFFKAHMAIYREGNVSYNTVMIVNTILMDFFVKYQRMFSRNIGMEFVEHVLSRLIGYEGFWQLINHLNIHIFYLTYRPQILVILSDALLGTYGSRNFNRISNKIPPYCIGEVECEEFRTNRSKFISFDTF